ncbi:hypothetical protein HMI56_002578 [Coelomomyces lativittatus]|nr:hypothetical protein HMI56_002578 [Coelomomyces lativittatus]
MRGKNSPFSEAVFVAKQILKFVKEGKKKIELKDFAVLVRTSSQTRIIEEEFNRQRILFKMIGGLRFYERAEIKDIISYLKILQNPYDVTSFLRIINKPPRKIGDVTISKLESAANTLNLPIYDILIRIRDKIPVPGFAKPSTPLIQLAKLLHSLQTESKEGTLVSLIQKIVQDINYDEFLKKTYPENFNERIENIQELIQKANEFSSKDEGLLEFLETVCLYSDDTFTKNEAEEKDEAVTICTLHASKGLEWPFVFIIGADDTLLPHTLSTKKEEIDEERRLLYVGITRSKILLHITWPKARPFMDYRKFVVPSPFLSSFNSKKNKDIWTKRTPKLTEELLMCYAKISGKHLTVSQPPILISDSESTSESEQMPDQDPDTHSSSGSLPASNMNFSFFSDLKSEKKRLWTELKTKSFDQIGFVSSKSLLGLTYFVANSQNEIQKNHPPKNSKKKKTF